MSYLNWYPCSTKWPSFSSSSLNVKLSNSKCLNDGWLQFHVLLLFSTLLIVVLCTPSSKLRWVIDFFWAPCTELTDVLKNYSDVHSLPVDFCFLTLPVSLNWAKRRLTDLLGGASVPNVRRTVTFDSNYPYHSTHWAFCWTDAISLTGVRHVSWMPPRNW